MKCECGFHKINKVYFENLFDVACGALQSEFIYKKKSLMFNNGAFNVMPGGVLQESSQIKELLTQHLIKWLNEEKKAQ